MGFQILFTKFSLCKKHCVLLFMSCNQGCRPYFKGPCLRKFFCPFLRNVLIFTCVFFSFQPKYKEEYEKEVKGHGAEKLEQSPHFEQMLKATRLASKVDFSYSEKVAFWAIGRELSRSVSSQYIGRLWEESR